MSTPTAGPTTPEDIDVDRLLDDVEQALLVRKELITETQAYALASLADQAMDPENTALARMLDLAHRVRLAWCGEKVSLESILSTKTGGCPEDCAFCSQSSTFDTDVKPQAFLSAQQVRDAAVDAQASGATEFCMVLAIKGPDDKAMAHILEYAESFFPRICTTHDWQERLDTCNHVRATGMELCSGGILGMGETAAQRAELALALAPLEPTEVRVNFLNPRPGTPLDQQLVMDPRVALHGVALFRLIIPWAMLRYAGGREVVLGDLQGSGLLGGANGMIIGNYLTTLGRTPQQDLQMLSELEVPVKALTGLL